MKIYYYTSDQNYYFKWLYTGTTSCELLPNYENLRCTIESVLREIKKSKALEKTSATKSWIGKFRSLNQVLAL